MTGVRLAFWDEDEKPTNEWDRDANKLLRRMLAAGISPLHPDPLAAVCTENLIRIE